MIVGTYTGGILALALTKPNHDKTTSLYKAEELVKFYKDHGEKIFRQSFFRKFFKGLFQNTNFPLDLFYPKYSREGKDGIIDQYLGETYMDEALTEVLITSYAINLNKPFLFTSNIAKKINYSYLLESNNFHIVCEGYQMKLAAMATSAAPTYFKPCLIHGLNEKYPHAYLIDGGVFANNPTFIGVLEAMNSYKIKTSENIGFKDLLVVSLGTGMSELEFNHRITNSGQLQWINPLVNMIFNYPSALVDYQMEKLLRRKSNQNDLMKQYYRFQPHFPNVKHFSRPMTAIKTIASSHVSVINDLDAVDKLNITNLEKLARQFVDKNWHKLKVLSQLLCRK